MATVNVAGILLLLFQAVAICVWIVLIAFIIPLLIAIVVKSFRVLMSALSRWISALKKWAEL